MATKSKRQKEADLFEASRIRPQWERLPTIIRKELIPMLRELLLSAPAQERLQQLRKGGTHE